MSHTPAQSAAAATGSEPGYEPSHEPGQILERLRLKQGHTAIVGLQWGDEGKGKVVDLLAPGFQLVVRYNGGANAGHSVQVGETRYALHLIPSGILYADKINVLGNGVVIDLEQLVKEIVDLRQRGVAVSERNLRLSDRAHVVLPYHKLQDALYEKMLAKAAGDDRTIGTTGRGIGPCYADKALRSTAVRVGDLLNLETLSTKLDRIVTVKNSMLAGFADGCGEDFQPINAASILKDIEAQLQIIQPMICDATALLHEAIADDRHLLFEGANATLLDVDHGTYPYVTSSNCSSLGVTTGTGVPASQLTHVLGVVKAYQTRVGGGPMPTELHDATGQRIRDRGKEYGTTTGRPRRCGWLDLFALKYTAMVSGATGLAIMLLDVLAGFEELKVCVGYTHKGRRLNTFPSDADVLDQVEPIYHTLPGFEQDVSSCKSFDQLPPGAQAYLAEIEKRVGVPVSMVSVGPRRDQTLFRG